MNLKMFMAVFFSAVLTTVVLADTVTTEATTNSAQSQSSVTSDPTTSTIKSSTSSKPTTPTTQTTTPTTTPKPIWCSEGSCDEGEDCFSYSVFGKNKTCQPGESCAVNETKINSTQSTYIVSCKSAADCQSIQTAGTGTCCHTDYCKPDLKAAKAKAKAKGNEKNGCDFPQFNKIVVISMTIVLYMFL